ncbi:MAG: hypothetical protein E7330_05570 [Clostridiales bacterium]|nr:hypothetical protein [Clostridiales bacterium]
MKRAVFLLCTILSFLLLCGCAKEEVPEDRRYSVKVDNIWFTVDPDAHTIMDGTTVYHYEISGGGTRYSVTFTYPDGETYTWTETKSGNVTAGSGAVSPDYNEELYVSGMTLRDVIDAEAPAPTKRNGGGNFLIGIIAIAIGAFSIASPETAWQMEYGWRYKDAEPSEAALLWNRIGGMITVIFGIFIMF